MKKCWLVYMEKVFDSLHFVPIKHLVVAEYICCKDRNYGEVLTFEKILDEEFLSVEEVILKAAVRSVRVFTSKRRRSNGLPSMIVGKESLDEL